MRDKIQGKVEWSYRADWPQRKVSHKTESTEGLGIQVQWEHVAANPARFICSNGKGEYAPLNFRT
jgi:hypothetical protein